MADQQQEADAEQLPRVIERSATRSYTFYISFAATIVVALLLGGYTLLKDQEVFVPRPITHNMPTVTCRPVTKEGIDALTTDPQWQHTVRSMYWHIKSGQLEGISAFHMGDPTCFVLISINNGKDILPMFNPVFRGYSTHAIVTRNEESLACPGVIRNMLRAVRVRVSYIDSNTRDDMVELFSDGEAFALQHINFYSLGHTICDLYAINADKGVATLRERLVADTFL